MLSPAFIFIVIFSRAFCYNYQNSLNGCQLGACSGAGQPCNWTILATVAFQNSTEEYIDNVKCYLNNISLNCHEDGNYLQTYLPGKEGLPPAPYNPSIINSLDTTSAGCNPWKHPYTVYDTIFEMESYAPNITSGGGLAMIFTDLPCNNVTNDWYSITSSLTINGYYIQVIFLGAQNCDCSYVRGNNTKVTVYSMVLPDTQASMTCSYSPTFAHGNNATNQSMTDPTQSSSHSNASTTVGPTTPPGSSWPPSWVIAVSISIPCIAFVILCAICACCCCKCMQIQKMKMMLFHNDPESSQRFRGFWKRGEHGHVDDKHAPSAPPMDPCTGQPVPNFAVSNHYMDIEQLAARNKKDEWEFNTKNLLIHDNEVLGAGAFATVYRATVIGKIPLLKAVQGAATSLENQDGRTEAAVKRLPAHADDQNRKDFFHEMEFMKRLGYHIHTIAMLGCVSDMWDPLIVVEYCAYGDLLRFVRLHRSDFFGTGSSSEKSFKLTVKQLVSFAWQISDGMSYLSSRNFVHRDLAARNILVTKTMSIKVSDFGLCRYTDEALYTAKGGKLPIKWMSPEALKFGEFSMKSDIWSFGILLWEVFSLGETPYNAVQPTDMLEHLEDGNRLLQPQFCPNEMYKIAEVCWAEAAGNRPTFDEVRAKITLMLNLNDESYGYLTVKKKDDSGTCAITVEEAIKL